MKGIIAKCLEELVIGNFGKDKWGQSLEMAGLKKSTMFMASQDLDDTAVIKVLQSVCKVCNITLNQAADAFGEYWVCHFAPKVYPNYYNEFKTAKDYLLKMNEVHDTVTKRIPNAKPPKFIYEWSNDKTLIMTYKSQRGLIDIFVGLVKGISIYFNANLNVAKIGADRVQITFP